MRGVGPFSLLTQTLGAQSFPLALLTQRLARESLPLIAESFSLFLLT